MADKLLKKPGVVGYAGLGAMYLGDDGTVYQVQGPAEENLDGLYGDELRGFAEYDELRGFAEDDELRWLEQEYVQENAVGGLEAYVPARRPETRLIKSPSKPPDVWKPLW